MGENGTTMTRRNGSARSALVTVLVALVALFGGIAASELADGSPNRQEVADLIQSRAPYTQDREFVRANIVDQAARVEALDAKIDALQVQLARIETKLSELLSDAIIIPDTSGGGEP